MNILVGALATASLARCAPGAARVRDVLPREHPHSRLTTLRADDQALLVSLDDGGVIAGRAESGDTRLLLLGCLDRSAPGWAGPGVPLDDADRTASYLLARFQASGLAFLDGLSGDVAVVVDDAAGGRVVLGAPPGAGRCLFYRATDAGLAYSSSIHALTLLLGAEASVDRSLEDFLLIYGFLPPGHTLFQGVRATTPGSVIEWTREGLRQQAVAPSTAWAGRGAQALEPGVDERTVTDALCDVFLGALEEQLPTRDDRAAVLLGGFDSALVAAGLHRLGKKVETYSFWYADGQYNQPHTDTLSKFLGTRHHWIEITPELFGGELDRFARTFNQATNWPNYVIQTAHVCDIIRSHGIGYCYTGDGCDSVFLGYPGTWRRARVIEALPTLPAGAVRALVSTLGRESLDRRLGHPYRVFMNLVRSLGRETLDRGFVSFRIMDELTLAQLRRGERPPQKSTIEELVHQLAAPHAALPALRLAFLGKALVSPNRNKLVGSSDRSGLAILSPYLHAGMKRFAGALPESVCRPDRSTPSSVTGKYILMRMAELNGLLPADVIYQPKVAAVDAPVDAWYAGPLRATLNDLFRSLPFDYDQRVIDALIDETLAERLFKRYVMTDKVISHAVSLLATYASFAQLARAQG